MGLLNWLHPKTDSDAEDANRSGSQPPAQVRVIGTAPASESSTGFDHAVDDAMCLLMYAAETGRNVDDTTRLSVLRAKSATGTAADDTVKANLLVALTKLAADLHPVTADSLRASCGRETKAMNIRGLGMWTCILAIPIIMFSVVAFVISSLSTTIRTDITNANQGLVKLRGELGTETAGTADKPELPKGLNEGDVITELQQYASTIRAIDATARQLNTVVFNVEHDPFAQYRWQENPSLGVVDEAQFKQREQELLAATQQTQLSSSQRTQLLNQIHQGELREKFQLTVGLPNMPKDLDKLTNTYQDVRSFAQDILDRVSVSYGSFTTCILPVLYALLGTCAYLLRCFEEELRTRTFMPSPRAIWPRFLVAGIGGTVVGLFGNFNITDGASISPLAVAFLVGYAVDVFFSFLEGLLQAFTKGKNAGATAAT